MTYHYHDESIIKNLPEDTVFVFGSNLAGTHQGGAAKTAHLHFGATKGVGRGWAGQSFAIPTMNEHLQQMPLSQIQHYIEDFKIYTQHHPKLKYFVTSVGCGVAGYKVEEIARMFKGISRNVIFPASFRPFVEKTLPKLTQKLLHSFINEHVISSADSELAIQDLDLNDAEKSLATIILNTPMYPTDSNGRDRIFEIRDIMHNLNGKIFNFETSNIANNISEENMLMGGMILALLELYHLNETDFIDIWQGKRSIAPPKPENIAKR